MSPSNNTPTQAPTERVNLVYRSRTKGNPERELPFRVMVLGDFAARRGVADMHSGKSVVQSVRKENFDAVLKDLAPSLTIKVADRLSGGDDGDERRVELKFESLADFAPDAIVRQDESGLKKVLELRRAFASLKGPYASVPAFRSMLEQILGDDADVASLRRELGIDGGGDVAAAPKDEDGPPT